MIQLLEGDFVVQPYAILLLQRLLQDQNQEYGKLHYVDDDRGRFEAGWLRFLFLPLITS